MINFFGEAGRVLGGRFERRQPSADIMQLYLDVGYTGHFLIPIQYIMKGFFKVGRGT